MKSRVRQRRLLSPRAAAQRLRANRRANADLHHPRAKGGSIGDEQLRERERLATVTAALSFSRWRRLP